MPVWLNAEGTEPHGLKVAALHPAAAQGGTEVKMTCPVAPPAPDPGLGWGCKDAGEPEWVDGAWRYRAPGLVVVISHF